MSIPRYPRLLHPDSPEPEILRSHSMRMAAASSAFRMDKSISRNPVRDRMALNLQVSALRWMMENSD